MKFRSVRGALRRPTSICLLIGVGGALIAVAQDVPTLKVDVKVINVLATVRDKHGNIVKNLNKDDFTLTEDSRPQTIKYFTQQSDLPLTLGLLVDTSTSQRRVLGKERDASAVFLDQLLRVDRDKAFVVHFDFDVELLQDLTNSRQKLRAALDELELGDRGSAQPGGGRGYPGGYPGGGGRRHGGGFGGGGTDLYDAVYLASDELMLKQQGRKAVILLSDGVDTGSKLTLNDAIESAQRADMIVYSILFSDESAYGGFSIGFPPPWGGGGRGGRFPGGGIGRNAGDGKKVMKQLAEATGGRYFEVSSKHPIEEIYASIQEDLRNQYNLGYSSDKPYDGTYRKIHVATKQKDLTVHAREGYFARQQQ
jgi:VWFA-related protein